MTVLLPTPLRQYTGGQRTVSAPGATVRDVFDALEAAHPGLKFRVVDEQGRLREHMLLFVNRRAAGLDTAVGPTDELQVILAISGG